ncbi:MAG: DUF3795 domain-containing protein [Planctomycetota bacterium]|jgi:hypothetical protein
MKTSLYGPCGIYCGACGATDCGGCHSNIIDETITGCKFRQCADEKGLEFCGFCPDYPCEKLAAFMTDHWPHHNTIKANQQQICSEGKEAWLAAQKKQWSCPDCGEAISWYQPACDCGCKLDAWDVPEGCQPPSPD